MTKLGTLLCTGMMFWAAPALAGFEFTPSAPAPASQSAIDEAAAAMDAPMPIIPSEPVSAEVLPAPENDPVISSPVSRAQEDPVYVRRPRSAIPPKIIKSQPMEAEALLTATTKKEPIVDSGRLVINPYPLEGDAIHGGDGGPKSVEQAMLEESGMLRPVATPGGTRTGLAARARPSAAKPFKKEPEFGSEELIVSDMTPFPGEEPPSLNEVEAVPVAPMPQKQLSAMPKPAPLQPMLETARVSRAESKPMPAPAPAQPVPGEFTDAVGFGRDLPLALALSQVVPPEYSYAFGQNVNVGTTVSWQGGKPWNVVLDEMLAQNGMRADIQDGQVLIHNAS